jgi:hypothetical protein
MEIGIVLRRNDLPNVTGDFIAVVAEVVANPVGGRTIFEAGGGPGRR